MGRRRRTGRHLLDHVPVAADNRRLGRNPGLVRSESGVDGRVRRQRPRHAGLQEGHVHGRPGGDDAIPRRRRHRRQRHLLATVGGMEYRRLGRTALRVSPLCLGTMNFGPLTTEPDSYAIMDRALDEGINFFDTANRYGGPKGPGVTEEIVGRWFAQGGGRREKVVLATKVYGPMTEWPNDGGLSARHIRDACEESLRRLQTDHIDLYQMHHVDRTAPWEEIWMAMETLVAQGKVVYVGSSNFAAWNIAQANEIAK